MVTLNPFIRLYNPKNVGGKITFRLFSRVVCFISTQKGRIRYHKDELSMTIRMENNAHRTNLCILEEPRITKRCFSLIHSGILDYSGYMSRYA
ncbi:hypothetical protein K1T71_011195 [Dendrolimus kikuchii]|uniref:Uncharacterized protein n=1 Tax=Dendrolimus kikuchii TaxID=765133 RepID=A0ACC1CNN3_9NEOP|nr:hypothetical protein K1T71_011195 [Dendrolimus kikuchii]